MIADSGARNAGCQKTRVRIRRVIRQVRLDNCSGCSTRAKAVDALRAGYALNVRRRNSLVQRVKMAKVRFQHFGALLAPHPRAVRLSGPALIDCSTLEAASSYGG